jgi:hypothetical protein
MMGTDAKTLAGKPAFTFPVIAAAPGMVAPSTWKVSKRRGQNSFTFGVEEFQSSSVSETICLLQKSTYMSYAT